MGSGKLTPNKEVVEAVKRVVPNFKVELPPGHFPFPPLPLMETKRLQQDTGFTPKFDTQSAIRHYVDWLKAGNPKWASSSQRDGRYATHSGPFLFYVWN
jgi:UDP-glucose 4-epimerase